MKDLSRLGRDIKKVIIVDNSPNSYVFQPENAIQVTSWFDDQNDVELLHLANVLEELANVDNVIPALEKIAWPPEKSPEKLTTRAGTK